MESKSNSADFTSVDDNPEPAPPNQQVEVEPAQPEEKSYCEIKLEANIGDLELSQPQANSTPGCSRTKPKTADTK